jgi:AcrR family transcriptional regulator
MPKTLSPTEVLEFRARLLAAAESLFARDGAAAVSMRRIAEVLGCSPATPYRYFKDKDEILATVRAAAFDRFAEALEAAFAAKGSAMERSAAVGRAYWDFALREPDAYRLMFDLTQPDDGRYPDLQRASARAERTMSDHVQAMIDDGWIQGDARLLGRVIWAAVHGIVVLRLAGKIGDDAAATALYREMTRLLFQGARAGLPPRADRQPMEATGSQP